MGVGVVTFAGSLLTAGVYASRAPAQTPAVPSALPRIGAARVVDSNDVGDPYILTVGKTSYRFGTTDWQSNVPAATSTNLVDWQAAPDALPVLPAWAKRSISMTWAPAVLAVAGHYIMYVATEDASSGRQCIAAASRDASRRPLRRSRHPRLRVPAQPRRINRPERGARRIGTLPPPVEERRQLLRYPDRAVGTGSER